MKNQRKTFYKISKQEYFKKDKFKKLIIYL